MLFNSVLFPVFLTVVFVAYWLLQGASLRWQNALLLVASYVFYGWWDWRFLGLIAFSSAVDYVVGNQLERTEEAGKRRVLLAVSLGINLGMLGVFKYLGFFVASFAELLHALGLHADLPVLHIILPVGISFYTFQTLSYTIDIYRRQLKPTRDLVAFLAFVSFFPQLVAGPIERASALLPQFLRPRRFDVAQAEDGLRQMLWGLAKKVIIADNLAGPVATIFADHAALDGITLTMGALFFALQIYCDFSGYSDIAIGCARLFGFDLMRNFAFPYFSRDIGEFWRRWHISLSTWFRDYVYIPLGGSRSTMRARLRNTVITFTISGLWHGANWTFIVWGLLNGLYLVPLVLANVRAPSTIVAAGRLLPSVREFGAMAMTFALTLLAWVFFRAESLSHAFAYLARGISHPHLGLDYGVYAGSLGYCAVILATEWLQREKQHGLDIVGLPRPLRWLSYSIVLLAIIVLGNTGMSQFIYFQF